MLSNVSIERDDDGSVWLRGVYDRVPVTIGAWPDGDGAFEIQESWSDINNDEPLYYVIKAEWTAILAEAQSLIDIWSA